MLPTASTEALCRLLQAHGLAGEAASPPPAPAAAPAALSRSLAALCFLTRDEAAALATLEALLLRQGGPSPPSCLRGALVRYKAEGRYQLARIDATLLRASGQLALRLSGYPRLVPPSTLSNANPLADGAAWQQEGQQELAALRSILAGRMPTCGEVAAACCRLATARQWAQQLDSVAAALQRDPTAVAGRLEDTAAIASLLHHIQPAEQPPAMQPQAALVAPGASVVQPPSAGVPGSAAVQPTAPGPLFVAAVMPLAASAMTAAPPPGAAPGQQVPAGTTNNRVASSTAGIAGTAAAAGNLTTATRGSGMSRHWSSDEERRRQRGRQRRRRFSFRRGSRSSSSESSSSDDGSRSSRGGSEGSRSPSHGRHTAAGQRSSSSTTTSSDSRSRRKRSSRGLGHSKGTKRSSRRHGKKSGRKHSGKKDSSELRSRKKGSKQRKTRRGKDKRSSKGGGQAGRQQGKERRQEKRQRQEEGQPEAESGAQKKRRRSGGDAAAAEQQELAGRSAADHSMRSVEEESLSEGELPRSPTAGQPLSEGMGGWASQGGDKWRAEQQREQRRQPQPQRQTNKWPHDKWDRDEAPRRGAAAPAGEVPPASPSGKRRLRGRGRRRSGRRLDMDRVQPTAGSVQPSGASEQQPLPPAPEQPTEALGQHWQSPEEQLAAEVAAEWRMKAQSPLWHRVMEGDVPRGSGNEALLLGAVAALEQAAAGGVHTALRFEEQLSHLDSGWKRRLGGHSAAQLVWELNRRRLVRAQVLAGPAGSRPTLAFQACSVALGGQQQRPQQQ